MAADDRHLAWEKTPRGCEEEGRNVELPDVVVKGAEPKSHAVDRGKAEVAGESLGCPDRAKGVVTEPGKVSVEKRRQELEGVIVERKKGGERARVHGFEGREAAGRKPSCRLSGV